ncbi:MAG: methylmalonyl-CoA mutase, N-terminal domain, partial [Bacteroidetes bacterium]|nr:methylmalonyl-CoA mutase, N-terminal domain [Bacteroidota bacterium]
IALRTQQIVAFESGVASTVDPLGGSYFGEAMTDVIEREADALIAQIDAIGGMVEAIEEGFVQTEIQKAAYRYTREVEADRRIIVGVNRYQVREKPPENLLRIDRRVQDEQIASLRTVRAGRNGEAVSRALGALRAAAEGDTNLMPPILEAVREYATVGEICDVLRGVFGEYKEHIVI